MCVRTGIAGWRLGGADGDTARFRVGCLGLNSSQCTSPWKKYRCPRLLDTTDQKAVP
jgi:hypothetical protein